MFLPGLKFATKSSKAPSGRNRRSRRSNFAGGYDPNYGKVMVPQDGIKNYAVSQGNPNVIETGRRSYFNEETPMHNNAVSLLLKHDSGARADLVLFAGDHEALYPTQLLQDGTNTYVNDDAANADVIVTAEYGIEGAVAAWDRIQQEAQRKGLYVVATRVDTDNKRQLMHKIRFKRDDLWGDHTIDHIFPYVYYNPSQFNANVIQSGVKFVIDRDTIVKYSLEPGEEVLLTFWVGGIYDDKRILRDHARQNGGNSLM